MALLLGGPRAGPPWSSGLVVPVQTETNDVFDGETGHGAVIIVARVLSGVIIPAVSRIIKPREEHGKIA